MYLLITDYLSCSAFSHQAPILKALGEPKAEFLNQQTGSEKQQFA